MSGRSELSLPAAALAALCGVGGCYFSYARSLSVNILVEGADPTAVKVKLAQAVASPENLTNLRRSLRARFGDSASTAIEGLRLEWRVQRMLSSKEGSSATAVFVVVHVPPVPDRSKSKEMLEYCAGIVRSDLAERLRQANAPAAPKSS